MRLVKAGLRELNAPELVGKCAHVENAMGGNTHFPAPTPDLATLSAARMALEAALEEAESGAHAAIARKNEAAKKLTELLVKLARYVNSVASGDVDMAVSSGFELAKVPQQTGKLDAPVEFGCRPGAYPGEVDLRWKRVDHARMYQAYMCEGDPATGGKWIAVGISSKARLTVKGLARHKLYSFRATALGAPGEGPLSEIAAAEAA